jgi:peroxiredoxin
MATAFYISYAVLWLLVVFQSLVLLGLARTVYQANAGREPEASPVGDGRLIGEPAPSFTAPDVSGGSIDREYLLGRSSALLFVTPDCTSCMATLDEVEALRAKVDGNVLVVCRASAEECGQLRETYRLENVPVIIDEDLEVSRLFDVHVAPTAVLVGANGRIQTYGQPMRGEEFAAMVAGGEGQPADVAQ